MAHRKPYTDCADLLTPVALSGRFWTTGLNLLHLLTTYCAMKSAIGFRRESMLNNNLQQTQLLIVYYIRTRARRAFKGLISRARIRRGQVDGPCAKRDLQGSKLRKDGER